MNSIYWVVGALSLRARRALNIKVKKFHIEISDKCTCSVILCTKEFVRENLFLIRGWRFNARRCTWAVESMRM